MFPTAPPARSVAFEAVVAVSAFPCSAPMNLTAVTSAPLIVSLPPKSVIPVATYAPRKVVACSVPVLGTYVNGFVIVSARSV